MLSWGGRLDKAAALCTNHWPSSSIGQERASLAWAPPEQSQPGQLQPRRCRCLFPSLSFGVDGGGDENPIAWAPFPATASPWPEYPGEAGHRHLASFPAPGRPGSWQTVFLPLIRSSLTQNEQDPEREENHGKSQAANPQGLVVWGVGGMGKTKGK